MNALIEKYEGDAECWDDVTGAPLKIALVREARQIEMNFFKRMGVFAEVLPKEEVQRRSSQIIRGRWIDIAKATRPVLITGRGSSGKSLMLELTRNFMRRRRPSKH